MRVLSIDPALRKTGFSILEQTEDGNTSSIQALVYDVITNPPKLLQSSCLVAIRSQLNAVIKEFAPDVCAIESTIYVQSYKTAIALGTARAAALIAAGEHGIPIYEYPPKRVKQAVVGKGAADKQQVAFMVRSMLRLTETPSPDAADAIAVGLTHINSAGSSCTPLSEAKQI
ncbi:MAG: crossover junction endodeoxyribonuclease RuvC [Verrucomicrobiota bacterium]